MRILDSIIKSLPTGAAPASSVKNTPEPLRKGTGESAVQGEGQRIVEELRAQGYEITTEEADVISDFVETSEGTETQKLQTVKSALEKGLQVNGRVLRAVHAALTQPVLSGELRQLLEGAPDVAVTERVDLLRRQAEAFLTVDQLEPLVAPGVDLASLAAAAGDAEAGLMKLPTDAGNGLEDPLKMAAQLLSGLAELLETGTGDTETSEAWTALAAGVRQLSEPPEGSGPPAEPSQSPQPLRSKEERLTEPAHTVTDLPELEKAEAEAIVAEAEAPRDLEALVTSWLSGQGTEAGQAAAAANAAGKEGFLLLMKEVTPVMQRVQAQFQTFRKEMDRELLNLRERLQTPQPEKVTLAETLDRLIQKVDKTLLKSEVPLYTSMETEKKLLVLSSKLQEAKTAVQNGDLEEATRQVAEVEETLKGLVFQPARYKVLHQAAQKAEAWAPQAGEALQNRVRAQLERILEPVRTPREVLEAFRSLGLTHESEVAAALGSSDRKGKEPQLPQENLRELLLKLAQDTDEKLTTVTAAEKTLSGLTGQQLLSRPEAKPQGQTLFLSLPMQLADRVEDLKIYVQSRKASGRMDWENCSFYFAVHTESFGDVGLRLSAVRKSVSVQVKCDAPELREALEPLAEDFAQAMGECGYRIAGISYSRLSEERTPERSAPAAPVTEAADGEEGKGLNVRI